jgi:hypothetical protein
VEAMTEGVVVSCAECEGMLGDEKGELTIFIVVTHFDVSRLLRRIDCGFVPDFFLELRLESSAVVSFGDVDTRVQMKVLVVGGFELYFGIAMFVDVRKLNVDVSFGVFSANKSISVNDVKIKSRCHVNRKTTSRSSNFETSQLKLRRYQFFHLFVQSRTITERSTGLQTCLQENGTSKVVY